MARKKKSQTDKPDASDGATEDVTAPSSTAQESPETDPAKSEEASAEDTAAPETTEQDSSTEDTAPETEGETATTDATPDPETGPEENTAEEISPDDTADTTQDAPDAPPQDETATTTEDEPQATAEDGAAPSPTDRAGDPTPVVRTEQVTVRQGGFWSMLIGGVAAAGVGVAAAPYIYPHLPVGQEAAPEPADAGDDGLATRLDEQAQRISDLGARIDEMPAPVDPSDELFGLSETVTSLAERVANLEVQLSNLEVTQVPEAPDTTATDAALDDLRDSLAAQSAEIEDLRATLEAEEQAARESARATLQRAALTRVMTALDTGDTFGDALADLRDTGASVPDALAEVAETGVPTRAQLVESFPDAARAALAAARVSDPGSGASVGDFLRAQLGIRSLEPREGDGPDAILSRAEAALAEGRMGDALAEIETLPEDARAAMSGWAANATTRRDALATAEALSAELN